MLTGEALIQFHVIRYVNFAYPDMLYCASAGGVRTGFKQAVKMKRTGYVKGFPDMMFLEPVGKHLGLFIELKTEKGVLSKEQKDWLKQLNKRGYLACCCYGFDDAKEVIDKYMSGKI